MEGKNAKKKRELLTNALCLQTWLLVNELNEFFNSQIIVE